MKQIKKRNRKKNLPLKLVAFFVFILCVFSFVFSILLTKKNRKEFSTLHIDQGLPKPQCNVKASFHTNAFDLSFENAKSDVTIYYTTDGSEPSLSSKRYTVPVRIEDRTRERNKLSLLPTSPRWKPPIGNVQKGTVVRAISVNKKNEKSEEFVKTFFITEKGGNRYSVPVIALTINEKHLFGYKQGIYVLGKSYVDKDNYIRKRLPLDLPWWEYPSNYLWRGSDSERPAHIEFMEPLEKNGFIAKVGVRIHGNATRGFAQKSLRICFRNEYGQTELNYDLFATGKVTKHNSFILRNSGNDWEKTMFRDAFMQDLMKGSHLDIQEYRPSVVFINGEYWGVHNIRERFDENYLANKYHISRDRIVILELSGKIDFGDKEDEESFSVLLDFVKENDLSKQEYYEHVLKKIDVKSLTDFIIANVYFCNSDWPNNNVKFWRYKVIPEMTETGPKDGRWRWMLYDTDWGFGYNSMSEPSSDLLAKATKVGSIGVLFSALLKNKDFKKEFLDRFQYHLNTTFRPSDCIKKIEKFKTGIASEIPEHIDRWRAIDGYGKWLLNIEVMKNFAQKRPQAQADQLNAFFHLTGAEQISIEK
jgi:hypothetical protein